MIVRSDLLAWATALSLVILAVRLRLFGYYEWTLAVGAAGRVLTAIGGGWGRFRGRRTRPTRRHLARLPAGHVWAILVQRVRLWNVSRLRLTLAGDDRPAWHHEWVGVYREPEAENGWAMAVAIRDGDGWTCEIRAAGGMTGDEFSSPAGLVRLLTTFASHFVEHKDQVVELADSQPAEPPAAWDDQTQECRAA